ncbi:MAG: DUF502 domain-containing protein [Candidatus Omnitrophica bacterium]|nr:DUF502 domain-containing protein [Candidatus Omnitrophota bacterium]
MKIRNYFATGFLIALPVFVTLYLIYVILRFIDGVFGKLINVYFQKHFGFSVPGVGIIIGIAIIFLIGFTAANFFGKKIIHSLERWFMKFPMIRQIYPAAKQIVDSFISKESPAFKKVVMVQYPCEGIWSVGFLTSDSFREANEKSGRDLMHVFIATTPSPLTGFLILVPRDKVKEMDMSIEEGIKLVISAGIVKPQLQAPDRA